MEVILKNCNNIDEAKINLKDGCLNIKYGMNGIGKSTIVKALELNSKNPKDLTPLTPFKYIDNDNLERQSVVIGADDIKSVLVFNDEYIDQFVFKRDEIIQNSFNIFIKNQDYDLKMIEIEKLIGEIKDTFKRDQELDGIIKDLGDLSASFGKSQSGYSKAGRIGKGLGNGNKIENIPDGLEAYTNFIKNENSVKWIGWQIEGNNFLDISSECPYCTSSTQDKKETILSISKEYDAKSVEHLIALKGIIDRLGIYFSKDTIENLNGILKNKAGLKKEEINYLTGLKEQIDTLRDRLSEMKDLSFFSFKDVEKVVEKIGALKIDIKLLPYLGAEKTIVTIDHLNKSLDLVLTKAGQLQGEINKQKQSIERTIAKYSMEINEFLKYAGYKYSVAIQYDDEVYKMKLRHQDFQDNIENADRCLSYGEKNAFSLVLFMYECLSRKPDLIILDDPISSFDRNKKFAIIEMLFLRDESFRGKLVLMMTHDFEPIIDIIKTLSNKFNGVAAASFLMVAAGQIKEIQIERNDILSFTEVCKQNVFTHRADVIKLIYLRRYYENISEKELEYQILSNLFKKRSTPEIKDSTGSRIMTQDEMIIGTKNIQMWMPDFNYTAILGKISDNQGIVDLYKSASSNYEKLQLFRIINTENHENDVVRKYINETFHIENEYSVQLNPFKYDFVPQYIVDECNKALAVQ